MTPTARIRASLPPLAICQAMIAAGQATRLHHFIAQHAPPAPVLSGFFDDLAAALAEADGIVARLSRARRAPDLPAMPAIPDDQRAAVVSSWVARGMPFYAATVLTSVGLRSMRELRAIDLASLCRLSGFGAVGLRTVRALLAARQCRQCDGDGVILDFPRPPQKIKRRLCTPCNGTGKNTP